MESAPVDRFPPTYALASITIPRSAARLPPGAPSTSTTWVSTSQDEQGETRRITRKVFHLLCTRDDLSPPESTAVHHAQRVQRLAAGSVTATPLSRSC